MKNNTRLFFNAVPELDIVLVNNNNYYKQREDEVESNNNSPLLIPIENEMINKNDTLCKKEITDIKNKY